MGYGFNKGINLARGKYVARMNTCDRMRKDRLVKQVQYLESNRDIALVGSWCHIIDDAGRVVGLREFPAKDAELKMFMLFMNPFLDSAVMVRTEVLQKYPYSDGFKYCEDHDLWIKITDKYKVANIPECLTVCRIQTSRTNNEYWKQRKQSMLELQSAALDAWGVDHSAEELAIHAVIGSRRAKQYFSSKKKQEKLCAWVNKILTHQQKRHYCPTTLREEIRDYILYDLCGIPLKTANNKEVVS